MSGQGSSDPLNNRGIVPSSPFEIQATQELLQQRIEAGDITQGDVDLIKQGYRWMSISATVGTLTCGLGTYLALRRRRPPVNMGLRLLGAGSMGMMGSFIGFTIGGAAASMEVERNMADAPRKMKVFADIAQDTRRQIVEHRAHQIEERTGKSPFPNGLPPSRRQRNEMGGGEPTWDPEGQEQAREADRERDMSADLGRIEQDGGFANQSPASASADQGGGRRESGRQEIARATRGTWDKIRQSAFGQPGQNADVDRGSQAAVTTGAGSAVTESERTKEQREFDAMLEKERQGVVGDDKWA